MDPSPPSDSSSDLRRSKRNKFHLDVTTMHLIHPERARKHTSSASPLPRENREDKVSAPPILLPQVEIKKRKLTTVVDEVEDENEEEIGKEKNIEVTPTIRQNSPKKRKSGTGKERNKPHKCSKCPASFDSMISLEIHYTLHSSGKKHTCTHCDYSSNSLHAVRTHIKMHVASLNGNIGKSSSSSVSPSSLSHCVTSLSTSSIDVQPLSIIVSQDESSNVDEEEEELSPIPPFLPANTVTNSTRIQTTFNGKYKCPICPFTTRDNERLDRHNHGHSKGVGFLCPLCTFKSESAGFLKRHVEIHGVKEYDWPPQYVGISPGMNGIIEKNEKEGSPTLIPIGKVLKAAHNALIPLAALQNNQSSSLLHLRPSSSSSTSLVSNRIENGNGIEIDDPISKGRKEMARGRGRGWRKGRMEKCREKDCTHHTTNRAKAVIHRMKNHWNKKIVSRRLCGECGMRLNGEGAKRIHWMKNHRNMKWNGNVLKKYRDERCGTKNEVDELPTLIREKYMCDECPYSSNVRSKLDRHHSKHVIREDFNCEFCSFSCRNNELLQSHQRIHFFRHIDKNEKEGEIPSTPTPTIERMDRVDRVESDSPPALERAESSMGEGEEMPVLESVGAPPVLEMEVDMKEENGKKNKGGRKKGDLKITEEVKERKPEQLRLIEKAVRIRNVGVIGIKRMGGEMKRKYKCIHCPFTAPFISMLWRHSRHHLFTSSSSSSSLHHCSDCTFTTSLLPIFSTHLSMHVQARDSFPCEFCPFVGISSSSLDGHIEWTGHGIPSIPSIPSRSSPSHDKSNVQMGGSKGEKPISFNFISSHKWMRPSNEEKKLLRLINNSKCSRNHQCPDCPFSDPNELIYNLHKEMHQGPKQAFECNVCSYSTSSPEGLHNHISLHIPPDTIPIKRATIRRRPSIDVIPSGIPSFDCSSCNFRTLDQAAFHVHKLEHAQLIQQRLVTQIKRCAIVEDEYKKKNRMKAITTKSLKQIPCDKCDFVCETASALIRHREFHGNKGSFECHICDYAASTKQITEFHIVHHHTKKAVAHLKKQAILMPESTKMKVPYTLEEKVKLAGQVFLCELCDSQFLEMRQILTHWEVDHSRQGDDTACHLSLGMLPTNRVLTKA
ncbi:spr-4 [Pristionchus pacificus]|uniref:Spr-4 n=1 Tax=Pristionchus pacificus TaxID=54126 RepID=A0A2A6CBU5_PRIPA|nr:spr-4 [Pristionchus pacificus]|eukprot:PDM75695.1 spr-4 [Pristionchus pacificus]